MLELGILILFMVFIFLGLWARMSRPRHISVSSSEMMQAIKKSKRTAIDEELEKRQKALKVRRG